MDNGHSEEGTVTSDQSGNQWSLAYVNLTEHYGRCDNPSKRVLVDAIIVQLTVLATVLRQIVTAEHTTH